MTFQTYYIPLVVTLFLLSLESVAKSFELSYQHQQQTKTITVNQPSANRFEIARELPKQLSLVTLDWPPYIDRDLCDKGWVFTLTAALFNELGFGISVEFFPWARSVRMAELGQADILFPEYFIEVTAPSDVIANSFRRNNLALSTPYAGGLIGLMSRENYKAKYDGTFQSIQGARIGVVRGYQNTPEFDKHLDLGFFNVIQARDDQQNLKLLLASRVDYIVADPNVVDYLLNHDEQGDKNQIKFIEPAFQYNDFYYAISKRNAMWQSLQVKINAKLSEFEQAGTIKTIQQTAGKCSPAN